MNLDSWPKKYIQWIKNRTLYVSVPFTWCLPDVRSLLQQRGLFWDHAVVGGPAVYLMPDYLKGLSEIGHFHPGVLQKINPQATRTTTGCIRRCSFCGVPKFEGEFKELPEWPDLPVICDNNLLAASQSHFDRVMDRLEKHGWADFNQGIDIRLLNDHHIERFSRIRPMIRLALDSKSDAGPWSIAFDRLRSGGIAKANIRSYALIGYDSDPAEAWERCEWIESHGIKSLPMWFHRLNQLQKNTVTDHQISLGWNDYERRRIMQWFYQHKKAAA